VSFVVQGVEVGLGRRAASSAADVERQAREQALVRRAQAGDRDAFEQLYRENVGRVYAVCMRIACDTSVAEEITQDAFVRAWQRLDSFRGESAFASWMYTLAVNLALTERRTRKRREGRVTATDDPGAFEEPPAAHGPEPGMDLERALAKLPPGARSVFVLHDVQGHRHDEIAAMTGVATGTSKAQLHRARRLLREALRR
jgi:RNA polymerase sigma-70 factor (ECF subfamily)